MQVQDKANEVILLHGCKEADAAKIVKQGFDERLAHRRGLYGSGVYFTTVKWNAWKLTANKFIFIHPSLTNLRRLATHSERQRGAANKVVPVNSRHPLTPCCF